MALYVIGQSNKVIIKRRLFTDDGHVIEVDPPERLPAKRGRHSPTLREPVLRGRPDFAAVLPAPTPQSRNSVVILRLRERSDIGSTFIDVLRRYAESLAAVGSKLVVVSLNEQLAEQFRVTGLAELIGAENMYRSTERLGEALEQAYRDALAWIEARD